MKKKTQRELADEAWLRAQQIDLTGHLASTEEKPESGTPIDGVPDACPGCQRKMTVQSGWTILSEAGTPWQHGHLICGACGHEVLVTLDARDALKHALHLEFKRRMESLAKPVKSSNGPRTRGAG